MTEGPKRHSTEPTLSIDPAKILSAEVKRVLDELAEAIASENPTPEQEALIARAQRGFLLTQEARDAQETLVPCPVCERCCFCHGEHRVTAAKRDALVEGEDPLGLMGGPQRGKKDP